MSVNYLIFGKGSKLIFDIRLFDIRLLDFMNVDMILILIILKCKKEAEASLSS